MKKLLETALENCSTKDIFLFRISCSRCGTAYADKAIRFSKAGITPTSQSKKTIYDALYEQEFRDARQAAVRIAAEHMNYCPICKRLVCNRCFLICDDLDLCCHCAAALHEPGKPVLSGIIEATV